VEQPAPALPAISLVEDFGHAPAPRQEEILKFLISGSLNKELSEIVQQNATNALAALAPHVQNAVRLSISGHFQERIGRAGLEIPLARVAHNAGVLPYLKHAHLVECFESFLAQMRKVGTSWRAHTEHGELLRSFKELGGLSTCPLEVRPKILMWLVRTYVGEPGGMTRYGHVREVFYSDTAAPHVRDLVQDAAAIIADELRALAKDRDIALLCRNQHIARRFEALLDLIERGAA